MITSSINGRGNRTGPIFPSVCALTTKPFDIQTSHNCRGRWGVLATKYSGQWCDVMNLWCHGMTSWRQVITLGQNNYEIISTQCGRCINAGVFPYWKICNQNDNAYLINTSILLRSRHFQSYYNQSCSQCPALFHKPSKGTCIQVFTVHLWF